ncbi:SWIM zinc finger family protein [Rhizosphaericola mali]|uniref:SWIM zinc finger family protein n=1 Tax=Rhizosphaericola mali TaxID=2545455 RepID=A0A5P2G319_9BACT|nr:SWIM zinc finger family protein [Rhizosphaericola mali]QES89885.1 SWIM zinc finger family protein [Rhizosphaericola mali]
MNFTEESILQLAPDDASAKAGKQLATTAKWVNAHQHDLALWGECKGSGKNPYFTQIDLQSIAFKCSCPSRKFPCKHGLGLLFLWLSQPNFFQKETELAEKVNEWLGKRQERSETKAAKADKPVDEAAQQKRQEQREQKVQNGLEELDIWMKDIIRTGIQSIPANQYKVFNNIKSRMVDAQASGIATMFAGLEDLNYYEEGWEMNLMRQFSKIFFIKEAYNNKEQLSPEWQQELRNWIGWNVSKEDLANLPVTEDVWQVLHLEKTPFEKLTSEKVWLYGLHSGAFRYQLQFYMPQQAISAQLLVPGNCIKAKVVNYPGMESQRIWIKDFIDDKTDFSLTGEPTSFSQILQEITAVKSKNPLKEGIPTILHQVKLVTHNQQWFLTDRAHKSIPAWQTDKALWKIWALTQMQPFDLFGIYDFGKLKLLSIFYQNRFYTI